jgi:hypothetical protein
MHFVFGLNPTKNSIQFFPVPQNSQNSLINFELAFPSSNGVIKKIAIVYKYNGKE